ncbi:hypothetical protein BBP40_000621 [Aspergillus hancockii]|nr:hypothetical protein BBP40_000621 [Aspergillus hancockii]
MQASDMKRSDWDSTATEYSKMPREGPLAIPCQRLLEVMNTTVSFASATTIIDIGCGPGTAVSFLTENYGRDIAPEARLVATDYSKKMVEATNSRKETELASGKDTADRWNQVDTQVVDAQDLSTFSSNSASHVMGNLVYFMLPDPRKGLSEAHRVAKDGGVFACTSWAKVEWMQFLGQAAREVRRARGSDKETVDVNIMVPSQWKSTEGVKGELEAVGFRDVHVEYIEFDWAVEDPEEFAEVMCKSRNPGTKLVVGDLSGDEVVDVARSYARIVREHGNVCKGVAVLGVGRK